LNIFKLFTNLQVFHSRKSNPRWKTHLFCQIFFDQVNSLIVITKNKKSLSSGDNSYQNNGQTIDLVKKCLSQNRSVFHRSFYLCEETNCMFVNNREIFEKLRGVNSVYSANKPNVVYPIFLSCLRTYSLFLYIFTVIILKKILGNFSSICPAFELRDITKKSYFFRISTNNRKVSQLCIENMILENHMRSFTHLPHIICHSYTWKPSQPSVIE